MSEDTRVEDYKKVLEELEAVKRELDTLRGLQRDLWASCRANKRHLKALQSKGV